VSREGAYICKYVLFFDINSAGTESYKLQAKNFFIDREALDGSCRPETVSRIIIHTHTFLTMHMEKEINNMTQLRAALAG
jgi:hypothetical protein